MKQLVIAISGMNATDNPGPGVGVARSLRESSLSDLRIIGLCYGSMESGAYLNDIVDASYLLPYPSEGVQPSWNGCFISTRKSMWILLFLI